MDLCEFAVHVRPAGDHWSWVVLDEDGVAARNGTARNSDEARKAAISLAERLTRCRMVTKGGW
jgi:hypothetical protein